MEGDGNLLLQVVDNVFDYNGDSVAVVVALINLVPVIARIDDSNELDDNVFYRVAIGLIVDVHLVDVPALLIVGENKIHDVFYLILKFR